MANDTNGDVDDAAVDGTSAEERAARARRLAEIARPTARDRAKAWQSHIDRAITEAAERGAFDDLPGKGKPLAFDTEVDDDMWLANHMLKGQGFRPAWIDRAQEIAAEVKAISARVDRFVADWTGAGAAANATAARDAAVARVSAEITDRITALNRKIDTHNIDVPNGHLQRRRVAAADVIAELRRRVGV
ncbi:MAG: DUF1992 domain-containing protein [Ardenticatenales bacterium]|nr:DUF1992 domain-containing protein [Ardenticatenales bacterium]